MARTLPVNPLTGHTAIGYHAGLPVWAETRSHGPLGFEDQGEEKPFELPQELPTDSAGLEELRTQAAEAFLAAHDKATADGKVPTAEDLAELDRLDAIVTKVEAEFETVAAQETERAERAKALRDKIEGTDETDETDETGGDTDDPAETDETDETGGDTDDTDDAADKAAADEAALVAAGGKAPRRKTDFRGAGRTGGRRPSEAVKKSAHPGFQIDPGVKGYKPGHVGIDTLALISDNIHPGSRTPSRDGSDRREVALGSFRRDFPEGTVVSEESTAQEIENALSLITDETRLKSDKGAGNLVAAGGWCAPSQVTYEYLGLAEAGDLLDLPELGISRGGVRFPIQPDFGTVFNAPGFLYTEAEMIAQTEDKPCFEVPCDGFDEVRLDAIGLCITAGILQNKGFPENVKIHIEGILNAHQHKISSYSIQKVLSKSVAISIGSAGNISAWDSLLNALEIAAIDITTRHRMKYGSTVEVILPTWARPVLRNDLAKRQGVDVNVVTDAVLDAHIANRNVRPQYVSDWQTGAAGQPGAAIGADGSTALKVLPAEIKFIAYPAGTFFRSQQDVIEVGNLYDQAQLKKNRYTALFTEDGIAVGKRGLDSRVYTVPLRYTGGVGERLALGGASVTGAA